MSTAAPARRPSGSAPTAKYSAWVARGAKQKLELESADPGPLGEEEVEVTVEH